MRWSIRKHESPAQLRIQRSDFWAAEVARFYRASNKRGGRCVKGGP